MNTAHVTVSAGESVSSALLSLDPLASRLPLIDTGPSAYLLFLITTTNTKETTRVSIGGPRLGSVLPATTE